MFLFQIMNLHNLSNYQVFTRDCWIFLNRNHGCYISREFYLRLLLFQNHLHFSFSKMQIFGIVVLRDCKQKQLTKYELEHRSHRRGRSHANLRPATLLTKRLWHRCFPVNFAKFLRTPFLQKTSGRLLQKIYLVKYYERKRKPKFCRNIYRNIDLFPEIWSHTIVYCDRDFKKKTEILRKLLFRFPSS